MIDNDKTGLDGVSALDTPADQQYGGCKHCVHWKAPAESEQQAYERFRLGLSRKRVKCPTGTCAHAVIGIRTTEAFAATTAEYSCRNFEPAPPKPPVNGGDS